jgi:hypothetical protein
MRTGAADHAAAPSDERRPFDDDSAAAYAAVGKRPQALSSLEIRAEVAKPIGERCIPAQRLLPEEATAVIRAFAAKAD